MKKSLWRLVAAVLPIATLSLVVAAEPPARQDTPNKYTLRYRFRPGQVLRWEVLHQAHVRTSIAGVTETLETVTRSIKVWTVRAVDAKGNATFAHSVDEIQMRRKQSGSPEVRYDSTKDKTPPAAFENVPKSLRTPLGVIQLDARGNVLSRERTPANISPATEGPITIQLPQEAIPVGHTWSQPYDVDVRLSTGGTQKIKTLQTFTLASVATGVATIEFRTEILTPIHDPAIEAQVAERETSGTLRFDVDAGRVLSQQTDLDKHVVGYRGQASSLHYLTRRTEKLLGNGDATAP